MKLCFGITLKEVIPGLPGRYEVYPHRHLKYRVVKGILMFSFQVSLSSGLSLPINWLRLADLFLIASQRNRGQ